MDADGSHLAGDLDGIVAAARSSGGLAIGSRYIPGGSIEGWPYHRWLLSWGANLYCRVLLGLRTRDCTSGFRCYTRDLLTHVGLDDVLSQGYSFQIEMGWRARRLGYSVVEGPIRFEDRVAGASKVSRGGVRRASWPGLRLRMLVHVLDLARPLGRHPSPAADRGLPPGQGRSGLCAHGLGLALHLAFHRGPIRAPLRFLLRGDRSGDGPGDPGARPPGHLRAANRHPRPAHARADRFLLGARPPALRMVGSVRGRRCGPHAQG